MLPQRHYGSVLSLSLLFLPSLSLMHVYKAPHLIREKQKVEKREREREWKMFKKKRDGKITTIGNVWKNKLSKKRKPIKTIFQFSLLFSLSFSLSLLVLKT